MKICYLEHHFSAASTKIVDQANEIVTEYTQSGYILTLRQLYYQFVARRLLPNSQRSYKRLGGIVADARNAGVLDWDTIEDRTRGVVENPHWLSPAEILYGCAAQFRYDLWIDQPNRVEVWVEKEALAGVFQRVCRRHDVALLSCRGYLSQSEIWRAGTRMRRYLGQGQTPIILHFGDHDPSGLDMTRDIAERLRLYAEGPVEVRRIALTIFQVHEWDPPPNPAKITDSRFRSYADEYGEESWELDALDPATLATMAESNILEAKDGTLWGAAVARQDRARSTLSQLAENYEENPE